MAASRGGACTQLFARVLESCLILCTLSTHELVSGHLRAEKYLQHRHPAHGVQLGLVLCLVFANVHPPYWETLSQILTNSGFISLGYATVEQLM